MNRMRLLIAMTVLTIPALPAAARVIEVEVDATAGPWSTTINGERMPYGTGDEKPAVVIPFDIAAGGIGILPKGTTSTSDTASIPPSGIADDPVDDKERKKRRYPSFYAPKLMYPVARHALIATFVDAKGVVISRAVPVGDTGLRIPIPENAAGLSLGFNDMVFTGNSGKLKVLVEIPD